MKIASDGWIYEVPVEAEFIEVTPRDHERAYVSFFDAQGEVLPSPGGDMLSNVAPVAPWPQRIVAIGG